MTIAPIPRLSLTSMLIPVATLLLVAFSIVLPPETTIAIAAIGLMAWVGFAHPALGLGVVAATIPLQDAIVLSAGPVVMTPTRLVMLPFLVGWGCGWLLQRHRLPITAPVIAWGLVMSTLLISVVNAQDRAAWGEETYRWGVGFALYLVAVSALGGVPKAKALIAGTSTAILLCVVVAAWQLLTHAGPATFQAGGATRAYGFFGEPNPLAAYLEMTVPLLAPIAILRASYAGGATIRRYGLLIVTAMGGFTLLLTQSRGGFLGLAAALMIVAILTTRTTRRLAAVGIVLAVMVILITPFGRSALGRFTGSLSAVGMYEQTTTENWAVHERMAHWKAGARMMDEHPLSGVGAGNFNENFREATSVWRFRIPRGHAHNSALQMGAQAGYTGLISYLVLLFSVGARTLRGVRSARFKEERALAIGALGVLVAVIVHGQFDYLHGLSLNLALALAFACAEPAVRSAFTDRFEDHTAL